MTAETVSNELTPAQARDLVLTIEKALRAKGFNSLTITGLLGAAFASSLCELPSSIRPRMVALHHTLLEQTIALIEATEVRERGEKQH